MRKNPRVLSMLALAALLSACAHANPGKDHRPPGPPEEAFTACEGLSEGDKVTFEGREGEAIEATCEERDGKLVAAPLNPPKRR